MTAITSEATLGAEDPGDARVQPRGLGERASHRLEGRLGDVVEVLAVVHVHVQRDLGIEGEGPEEVFEQLQVEVADARAAQRHVEDEVGPARDVHGGVQEGFIHGQEGRAVADDARLVAQRLAEGLAQADPHVLHRVVEVDLEIAAGIHGQVHEAVLGPGLEHVAEERDARLHLGGARAIEADLEHDLRLLGPALDPALARNLGSGLFARWLHVRPPVFSMRTAAAAAWPSSPSMRASSATCGPASASPALAYSMTLRRLTKSSVVSAEAKRAVPPVGRTWLGPAT